MSDLGISPAGARERGRGMSRHGSRAGHRAGARPGDGTTSAAPAALGKALAALLASWATCPRAPRGFRGDAIRRDRGRSVRRKARPPGRPFGRSGTRCSFSGERRYAPPPGGGPWIIPVSGQCGPGVIPPQDPKSGRWGSEEGTGRISRTDPPWPRSGNSSRWRWRHQEAGDRGARRNPYRLEARKESDILPRLFQPP